MFKKDSLWLGMWIRLVVSLVLFGIIYLLKVITGHLGLEKAMFVCVALNIVPIRYYLISAKLDRTGRGILLMTVILIVAVTMIHL